jgi:tetratricopeptide (TPR) repeat protein
MDYLGRAYFAAGASDQARETWRELVALMPEHSRSLAALLQLAQQENRFEDAAEWVRKLVEVEPWEADWRFEQAAILTVLGGRTVEAAEAAEAGHRLDPTQLEAYPLTINLLRRLGRFVDALRYERRAEELAASGAAYRPTPPPETEE